VLDATPPPSVPTPAPSLSSIDPKAAGESPELRLGHYSTPDGLFGLVLDRTATPPRARIDGKEGVIELAIRRDGQAVRLLSASGELLLLVDERGAVSKATPTKTVRLVRDAGAQHLPAPPVPEDSGALLRNAEAKAKETCGGATIRFELEGSPAARGTFHTVQRTVRMLEAVCRDAAGKAAVKKKVARIRIGQSASTKVTFTDASLSIAGDLEGEALGPHIDEMQPVLEGKL
jgi:hypothetical protein